MQKKRKKTSELIFKKDFKPLCFKHQDRNKKSM